MDFSFGAGDSLPLIAVTVRNADGTPADLTGATVTLARRKTDDTDHVSRLGSIVGDPLNGDAVVKVFDAGAVASGTFKGRVKVLFASTEQISIPAYREWDIEVTPDASNGDIESPTAPSWSVADITTLAASIPRSDDAVVRVKSVRSEFYLDRTSTLTPDGITNAAAVGGGRWIRKSAGDLYWQIQTTWFYDAGAGDNEANGASGHPIKDMAELWRRVLGGTALTDVTVTVAGGPGALTSDESDTFTALSVGMRQWTLA